MGFDSSQGLGGGGNEKVLVGLSHVGAVIDELWSEFVGCVAC